MCSHLRSGPSETALHYNPAGGSIHMHVVQTGKKVEGTLNYSGCKWSRLLAATDEEYCIPSSNIELRDRLGTAPTYSLFHSNQSQYEQSARVRKVTKQSFMTSSISVR